MLTCMVKRRIDAAQGAKIRYWPVRQADNAFYHPATYDHFIDMLAKRANGMVEKPTALQHSFRLVTTKTRGAPTRQNRPEKSAHLCICSGRPCALNGAHRAGLS